MSHVLDRLSFFTHAKAEFADGPGVMTTEDRYAAFALDYVALYEFGFTGEAVRSGAVFVAILIGALIAIEFFGKRLGKAK